MSDTNSDKKRFPIDDLMDKLPSLSRDQSATAIMAYAAEVVASACMPLIEENAHLKLNGAEDVEETLMTVAYAEGRKEESQEFSVIGYTHAHDLDFPFAYATLGPENSERNIPVYVRAGASGERQ